MNYNANNVKWDLTVLYPSPDSQELKDEVKFVTEESQKIEADYKEIFTKGNFNFSNLKDFFERTEKIYRKLSKLFMYAYLYQSEDTSNHKAGKLLNEMNTLSSKIESILVFSKLALSKLSKDEFEELFNKPKLAEYKHFVKLILDEKKYLLSEPEEKLINLKNISGKKAFLKLLSEFNSAARYNVEIEGEMKELNDSQVRALKTSPDNSLRKKAFELTFKKPYDNKIIYTNIYNALVKDWINESEKREYPSSISPRNLSNEVSDKIIESLIKVTNENNKLVHKYYKLKAKIMKRDKLLHSDIYAPLKETSTKYTWEEAKNMVLDAMNNFDEEVMKKYKEFFDGNYIHAEILPSKRGGAFCFSASPDLHPFVLVNYSGDLNDVMTLAHELGHGLHGEISRKQNIFNYETPLTTAETASVFSEMIMTDYLLENIEDKEEKISLIAQKLESMFATMNRQNLFTSFELKAHEAIKKEFQSFEDLSDIYLIELKKMFGDSIEYFDFSSYEWAGIPHIYHTPFYCYAYNFAQLMVVSLYEIYLEKGDSFKEKYLELLSSGGSDSPENLLEKLNVDISKPDFWQRGFDFIKRRFLDKLEELLD